jgi:hypothetical protein
MTYTYCQRCKKGTRKKHHFVDESLNKEFQIRLPDAILLNRILNPFRRKKIKHHG